MSPIELKAALAELCAEIGPKAQANAMIGSAYRLAATLYPDDILGKVRLSAEFNEWAEAVPALRAVWEEHRDLHASNVTKGMALAIIRLTAELGECTDAALRCDFSPQEIERHGDAAAELATVMGGNGPFKIVKLAPANFHEEAA